MTSNENNIEKNYYLLNPYMDFVKTEGIPVVEGFSVDCSTLELAPWHRLGGRGAYIHLVGRSDYLSCYLVEIPAGGHLNVERHLHDELIYVIQGHGATTIELPGGKKYTFEWQAHSLFSIPLNAQHQHFNVSGLEPVRFAAVTNLPIIINLFHNVGFIFDNPYFFPERVGEDNYFQGEGEFRKVKPGRHQWETNFVADLTSFKIPEWKARGGGGKTIHFVLSESTMSPHIAEFQIGSYKKAHRHGAGAHIFCVTGHGYSLLWKEGQDPVNTIRVDWKPGILYAPPDELFHQHFNTAAQPSRYLAIGFGGVRYPTLEYKRRVYEGMDISTAEGGFQIEYEDEDPRVRRLFEEELSRQGLKISM